MAGWKQRAKPYVMELTALQPGSEKLPRWLEVAYSRRLWRNAYDDRTPRVCVCLSRVIYEGHVAVKGYVRLIEWTKARLVCPVIRSAWHDWERESQSTVIPRLGRGIVKAGVKSIAIHCMRGASRIVLDYSLCGFAAAVKETLVDKL